MPTYDYQCQKCDHQFEVFQSMNADKLVDCPEQGCEGSVKRLIGTGAGLIFKGGGFYQTDYRSDSYRAGAKKESEAKTPKKKESSSKSDSSGSKSSGSSTSSK